MYSPTNYEFSADQGFASIDQLTQAGAGVYVASGGCEDRRMTGQVTDLYTDIQNLGKVLHVEDKAKGLIDDTKNDLTSVETATKGVKKLKVAQVYYEGGQLQAIGAGIEYDILKRAGADNVYGPDQPEFKKFFAATISPESLASKQPEAIVFAAYSPEHEKETRDYLKKTFPDMPAVKNNRIIVVSTSDMFPGTLGNVKAVKAISQGLYPEAY